MGAVRGEGGGRGGGAGVGTGSDHEAGTAPAHEAAHAFEFGAAPRDDALTYPGAIPPGSFLFTGDAIEWIDEGAERDGLRDRLAALGVASMDERHAVLAYGSNRSPAQLRAKFAGSAVSPVVPVLRGRVSGLSVVYSCHITRYGSVPATLVVEPGADTEVAVTFLDDAQRSVIDGTEPVHEQPVVDGDQHPLRLVGGALVASYRCYRSTRAVLALDGRPVRLAEILSVGSGLSSRAQAEMQAVLLGLWSRRIRTFDDPRSFITAVRADPGLLIEVDRCLAALVDDPDPVVGAVAPNGFGLWPEAEDPASGARDRVRDEQQAPDQVG